MARPDTPTRPARARRGRQRAKLVALAVLLVLGGLLVAYAPIFDGRAPRHIDRARADAAHAPAPRRVLLVSIDGLAPRVLAVTPTPVLDRLAAEGLRAADASTVLPSITLTSHASMLAGVPPEVHGVDWNSYRPWRAIEVPTLFTHCARAALRCGLFAGKVKFVHFAEREPGVERYAHGEDAAGVLAAAAAFVDARDPDLAVVHLAEVDLAGHASGWGSSEQRAALADLDVRLGPFLERVAAASPRPLAAIVTADHGGHGTRHGGPLPDDVAIPWIAWGDGIHPGVIETPVLTMDTAATVLALLGLDVPAAWAGRPRLGGLGG